MTLLVLEPRLLVALAVTTLLPYLPLLFALMPFDEVVSLVLKAIR